MYSNPPGPPLISGPSQPEWRLPPPPPTATGTGTGGTTSSSGSPVPPPPHPSMSTSYNPNAFGPMPGASVVATGVNTTAWGVRFNQHHHQAHSPSPPPLPPRPSGASDQVPSRIQSPAAHKPLPTVPPYGSQIASEQHQYEFQPAASPAPPPPPPIPPVYQSQLQQQKDQTWQLPSAPVAEQGQNTAAKWTSPSPAPAGNSLSQPQLAISTSFSSSANDGPPPPPVPPKTSSNVFPTSNSAMGPFSPSDWEHLGPTPGDIDDTEVFSSKKMTPVPPASTAYPPPSNATAASSPASNPYVPVATPPQNVSPSVQISHADNQTGMRKSSTASPVSSSSVQESQHQYIPSRVNTADSIQSSAPGTTEQIDGVIEAWTRPLSPGGKQSAGSSRQSSQSRSGDRVIPRKPSPISIPTPKTESAKVQRSNTPGSTSTPGSSTAKSEGGAPHPTVVDPYEDLDPWFKSSLARYVAMLRKEAVADSDEERYKIFTAFTVKETKLREILYGIEDERKNDDVTTKQETPNQQQSTETQQSTEIVDHSSFPVESGLIPVESEESIAAPTYDDFEDGEYSPGGRPIIPRINTPSTLQRPASQPPGQTAASRLTDTGSQHGVGQFSRSTSVPPSMNNGVHKSNFSPLATNPPQPIYTPFRYMEGPQRGSDNLAFDRPAYEAYSDLRQASAESGRVMSNAPNSGTPNTRVSSPAQNQHDETFIGLIREKSLSYKKRAPRRTSSPPPLPLSLRHGRPAGPITELRSMVSSPLAKQSESSWHATTRTTLEQYSDDFAYIQKTIDEWEASAKPRRKALDKERLIRQEESEMHVDSLFNSKEIGYADINVLEEEFRQAEARVQLDEERKELEDFIKNVFDPLDERLKQEIAALRTHYDAALGQLDHENSKLKDSVTDKYNLSYTMKAVNDIYRKLEMRYQRRLNIALDRERRRKKTERRPLVFMGDSPALKRLDADFDQMERWNILEAAKDRDDRANRLMDSFDDAILHGLGENQSLLDEVSSKVKGTESSHLRSSDLSDSEIEQILKSVSTLVDSLRKDSESMMHNFGVADSTLNNADYRVSVAEARYTNADHEVYSRLAAEKKKEDAKIQEDLKSKLGSVRDGPAAITRKINELLEALGKEPVSEPPTSSEGTAAAGLPVENLVPGPRPLTGGVPSKKPDEDPDHQQRMRRALEAAKKRNAAKSQGIMTMS